MATLNTLRPSGDGTIDAVILHDAGTGAPFYSHIDEGISGGADYVANDQSETTGSAFFTLNAVNTDFGSILTLLVNATRMASTFDNDTCVVTAQVFASDETTAYTDAITLATQANTSKSDLGATAFTINATGLAASKANWDAARLKITWTYSKAAGPDNGQVFIYSIDLTGTYDISAGGQVNVDPDAMDFAVTFDNVETTRTRSVTPNAMDFATTFDNVEVTVRKQIAIDSMNFASYIHGPNEVTPSFEWLRDQPLVNDQKIPYVHSMSDRVHNANFAVDVVLPDHQANDILVVAIETIPASPSTPSGWTAFPGTPVIKNTWSSSSSWETTNLALFWKRASSSSETFPALSVNWQHIIVASIAIRGARQNGNPFEGSYATTQLDYGHSTTHSFSGMTTDHENSLSLLFFTWGLDGAWLEFTDFSSSEGHPVSDIWQQGTAQSDGGGIVIAQIEMPTPGATGTISADNATTVDGHVSYITAFVSDNPISAEPASSDFGVTFDNVSVTVRKQVVPDAMDFASTFDNVNITIAKSGSGSGGSLSSSTAIGEVVSVGNGISGALAFSEGTAVVQTSESGVGKVLSISSASSRVETSSCIVSEHEGAIGELALGEASYISCDPYIKAVALALSQGGGNSETAGGSVDGSGSSSALGIAQATAGPVETVASGESLSIASNQADAALDILGTGSALAIALNEGSSNIGVNSDAESSAQALSVASSHIETQAEANSVIFGLSEGSGHLVGVAQGRSPAFSWATAQSIGIILGNGASGAVSVASSESQVSVFGSASSFTISIEQVFSLVETIGDGESSSYAIAQSDGNSEVVSGEVYGSGQSYALFTAEGSGLAIISSEGNGFALSEVAGEASILVSGSGVSDAYSISEGVSAVTTISTALSISYFSNEGSSSTDIISEAASQMLAFSEGVGFIETVATGYGYSIFESESNGVSEISGVAGDGYGHAHSFQEAQAFMDVYVSGESSLLGLSQAYSTVSGFGDGYGWALSLSLLTESGNEVDPDIVFGIVYVRTSMIDVMNTRTSVMDEVFSRTSELADAFTRSSMNDKIYTRNSILEQIVTRTSKNDESEL